MFFHCSFIKAAFLQINFFISVFYDENSIFLYLSYTQKWNCSGNMIKFFLREFLDGMATRWKMKRYWASLAKWMHTVTCCHQCRNLSCTNAVNHSSIANRSLPSCTNRHYIMCALSTRNSCPLLPSARLPPLSRAQLQKYSAYTHEILGNCSYSR